MKTSKITIRSLFGIKEKVLNGTSVEITGKKGAGKTSILDAIRYALTNSSNRDLIIKQGADEGEILIETDTGLSINRKARNSKANVINVSDNDERITKPESYLKSIISTLQLNPVEFTQMSKQEQNRAILDLIEFDWDMNWIREKFGEIPTGVDYNQNILQVLNDIQSEKGVYYQSRQDINRDIRNKRAFISDIAKDLPENYNAEQWENYDLQSKYTELLQRKDINNKIDRAQQFRDNYNNKLRGLQAQRDIDITAVENSINNEREQLKTSIARMKAEITSAEDKLNSLNEKLDDKISVINANYNASKEKLDKDTDVASQYADMQKQPVNELQDDISYAEQMKKHLSEYKRMKDMQADLDALICKAEEYTAKIELARNLPGEILQKASLPVEGLTVENGVPYINGLPISNCSDGELLELCVDVAISKPSGLQIILIDGAEKLDDESRELLYNKCKEKGLQFIATRTTNDNELIVTEL